jgi:hypothetical protein
MPDRIITARRLQACVRTGCHEIMTNNAADMLDMSMTIIRSLRPDIDKNGGPARPALCIQFPQNKYMRPWADTSFLCSASIMVLKPSIADISASRTSPPTSYINPLRKTTALLALNIHDVRVTSAPAAHTILLGRIPVVPVLVLFDALMLVEGRGLKVRLARQLSHAGGIGGTVLDRRVPVPKVAEVVNIARREKGACREGVNWCVTPLRIILATVTSTN